MIEGFVYLILSQAAPPVSIAAGTVVRGSIRYSILWSLVTADSTPANAVLYVVDMRWLTASAKQSSALVSTQVCQP